MNAGLIKTYFAGAAVSAHRIVKFSGADIVQAAAATDASVGVSDLAAAANSPVDVVRTGIAPVEYGGTVTAGDMLTSDSTGRAVTATPSTGANNRVIGIAEVAGVAGDIGSVLISPAIMQG